MPIRVNRTGKDKDGDITSLCGAGWVRSKRDAIRDIESGVQSYYVEDNRGRQAAVQVVKDPSKGKYLRTDPNSNCSDNLDNLPDC